MGEHSRIVLCVLLKFDAESESEAKAVRSHGRGIRQLDLLHLLLDVDVHNLVPVVLENKVHMCPEKDLVHMRKNPLL